MMPPWNGRLDDQQIWDAVVYAWTLHTTAAEIGMGQAVYENNCQACHGADGKGKPSIPDLTDFALDHRGQPGGLGAGGGEGPRYHAGL